MHKQENQPITVQTRSRGLRQLFKTYCCPGSLIRVRHTTSFVYIFLKTIISQRAAILRGWVHSKIASCLCRIQREDAVAMTTLFCWQTSCEGRWQGRPLLSVWALPSMSMFTAAWQVTTNHKNKTTSIWLLHGVWLNPAQKLNRCFCAGSHYVCMQQ